MGWLTWEVETPFERKEGLGYIVAPDLPGKYGMRVAWKNEALLWTDSEIDWSKSTIILCNREKHHWSNGIVHTFSGDLCLKGRTLTGLLTTVILTPLNLGSQCLNRTLYPLNKVDNVQKLEVEPSQWLGVLIVTQAMGVRLEPSGTWKAWGVY